MLFGRGDQLDLLAGMVDGVRAGRGRAVVVRGAAGVGKSALLTAARAHADTAGVQILSCAGVRSETHLPFAGLLQLLRPVLGAADRLGTLRGTALLGGLGLREVTVTEPLVLATAVVDLIVAVAGDRPALVVADDVQWLDRSSVDVLGFLARRLGDQPVGLIAAVRDDDDVMSAADLPELRLGPLSAPDAEALLTGRFPDLPADVRDRVLDEADGNPLALLELPLAIASAGSLPHGLPRVLPLTDRLERAFAARAGELPPAARAALLTAALDDGDQIGEILAAASVVHGEPVTMAEVGLIVRAGLMDADEATLSLRFRHPLVRSAVHQTAGIAERHAVHTTLAGLLAGNPDRAAWHRAACSVAPDEGVALALEQAAGRARARGALATAVTALERAVRLTPDRQRAGGRLLMAADTEFEGGRNVAALRLVDEAERHPLGVIDRNRVRWLREVYGDDAWTGTDSIYLFADTAERMWRDGDPERAVSALVLVSIRCYWTAADPAASARVAAVAADIGDQVDDVRIPAVLGLAAPVDHGVEVRARMRRLADQGLSARDSCLLAAAATAVGDPALATRMLDDVVSGLRDEGRAGRLTEALVQQTWADVLIGASAKALPAARDAAQGAVLVGRPRWGAAADAAHAVCLARAGDLAGAAAMADRAERYFSSTGASPMLALVQLVQLVQLARGAASLAAGRPAEALTHLLRISDPSDVAHNPHLTEWGLVDLVEAAVLGNRPQAVSEVIASLTAQVAVSGSPMLRAGLAFARRVLDQDFADLEFSGPPSFGPSDLCLADWPLTRARLLLAASTWHRRQRRVAAARDARSAAEQIFTALGATAFLSPARPRRAGDLTDQELQVAELAAAGHSNRAIGERLFMSPRTVSTHLYRVFPKLGVTSRADLTAALSDDVDDAAR
ncbi:LuxR family transcriptional regulator [Actinoplanes sp. NPDC051411]|uniref:LuxR family transcriptional regulator n=1 Tax=Actinoplanes sp. NPDC051411 TaxID=3155522 RepID=UPI0034344095